MLAIPTIVSNEVFYAAHYKISLGALTVRENCNCRSPSSLVFNHNSALL